MMCLVPFTFLFIFRYIYIYITICLFMYLLFNIIHGIIYLSNFIYTYMIDGYRDRDKCEWTKTRTPSVHIKTAVASCCEPLLSPEASAAAIFPIPLEPKIHGKIHGKDGIDPRFQLIKGINISGMKTYENI